MSSQAIRVHYTDAGYRSRGIHGKTACGKSLRFIPRDTSIGSPIRFSGAKDPEVTEKVDEVTCARCRKIINAVRQK